jgi:hypothetical protein
MPIAKGVLSLRVLGRRLPTAPRFLTSRPPDLVALGVYDVVAPLLFHS